MTIWTIKAGNCKYPLEYWNQAFSESFGSGNGYESTFDLRLIFLSLAWYFQGFIETVYRLFSLFKTLCEFTKNQTNLWNIATIDWSRRVLHVKGASWIQLERVRVKAITISSSSLHKILTSFIVQNFCMKDERYRFAVAWE